LPLDVNELAGTVLTNTRGIAAFDPAPDNADFTSFQLSSAGSFEKLAGNFPDAVHGPLSEVAFIQTRSLRR